MTHDPLRVAIIAPGYAAGVEDPFVPAWRGLVQALGPEHDVTVFALRHPNHRRSYDLDGAAIESFASSGRLRHAPRLWLDALRRIVAADGRRPFDVVHALHANEAGFLGAVAARWLGVPLVVHVGGGELTALPTIRYGSARHLVERPQTSLALRAASVITAGSHGMRGRVAARRSGARVLWAPYGVDLERFRPSEAGPSGAVVHVADMNPVKDQATLLRAFATLTRKRPDARLHLVGGGRLAGRLRSLARRLGLGERIHWWGAVPHSAVHLAYRRGSAFGLSSLHEAQGIVLAEAAACGVPIASTHVGMAADLPAEGRWLAEPGDDGALAVALEAALDPGNHATARESLRRAAEQDYGLAAAAGRVAAAYALALGQPSP